MSKLTQLLVKYQTDFTAVLPAHLQHGNPLILDLTDKRWLAVDLTSPLALYQYTKQLQQAKKAQLVIGRYAEDRAVLYKRELFQTQTVVRSIHLGIDLTVPVNTPVFAPLAGKVHSFKNNKQFGDYGPTIILEHHLEDTVFFTLYGHLSLASLKTLTVNKIIQQGEQIGRIGNMQVNGGWPPHLHFQIIADMQNYQGDFPGVIELARKDEYLKVCPDPNLILQIKALCQSAS